MGVFGKNYINFVPLTEYIHTAYLHIDIHIIIVFTIVQKQQIATVKIKIIRIEYTFLFIEISMILIYDKFILRENLILIFLNPIFIKI